MQDDIFFFDDDLEQFSFQKFASYLYEVCFYALIIQHSEDGQGGSVLFAVIIITFFDIILFQVIIHVSAGADGLVFLCQCVVILVIEQCLFNGIHVAERANVAIDYGLVILLEIFPFGHITFGILVDQALSVFEIFLNGIHRSLFSIHSR